MEEKELKLQHPEREREKPVMKGKVIHPPRLDSLDACGPSSLGVVCIESFPLTCCISMASTLSLSLLSLTHPHINPNTHSCVHPYTPALFMIAYILRNRKGKKEGIIIKKFPKYRPFLK
jgi:hypothetical protein